MKLAIAIPAVAILVLRAWSNNSLTPLGLVFALVVAIVHAAHPWPVFFAMIVVFFLGGTAVTKVKKHEKAKLTHSSTGEASSEGPRNHIQVVANSAVATVLVGLHAWQLYSRAIDNGQESGLQTFIAPLRTNCWAWGSRSDVLVAGIVAQYAAATADTFASELGILSKSPPRLITSLTLRVVPPGTNGGVSMVGTLASLAGAMTIALTGLLLMPFCESGTGEMSNFKAIFKKNPPGLQGGSAWGFPEMVIFVATVTIWGGLGCLLDSVLGATLQSTVIDAKTGRVIEGKGGRKVLVLAPADEGGKGKGKDGAEPSRKVVSGLGLLDNNGVNFVTSLTMAVAAMLLAVFYWNIPVHRILA